MFFAAVSHSFGCSIRTYSFFIPYLQGIQKYAVTYTVTYFLITFLAPILKLTPSNKQWKMPPEYGRQLEFPYPNLHVPCTVLRTPYLYLYGMNEGGTYRTKNFPVIARAFCPRTSSIWYPFRLRNVLKLEFHLPHVIRIYDLPDLRCAIYDFISYGNLYCMRYSTFAWTE